jgi:hypothetical protein
MHTTNACHATGPIDIQIYSEDTLGAGATDNVVMTLVDTTPATFTGPGNMGTQVGVGVSVDGTVIDMNLDIETDGLVSIWLDYIDVNGTAFQLAPQVVDPGMQPFAAPGQEHVLNGPFNYAYSFAIPGAAFGVPGAASYVISVDGPNGVQATYPTGALYQDASGISYTINVGAGAEIPDPPHPFFGYVKDTAGVGVNLATVQLTYFSGQYYTHTLVTANDLGGNPGYYQFDIGWWNTSDPAWVNATLASRTGQNYTDLDAGDNWLDAAMTVDMPDDDREFVNVTLVDAWELKLTMGWNIFSIPVLRHAGIGLTEWVASDLVAAHRADSSVAGTIDTNMTVINWTGAAFNVYIDGFGGTDFLVSPFLAPLNDRAYMAYVAESWFTDEQTLAMPETGILITGAFPDSGVIGLVRNYDLNAGWNLVGWTSFANNSINGGSVGTGIGGQFYYSDLMTGNFVGGEVPEVMTNYTAFTTDDPAVSSLNWYDDHYEGVKAYWSYLSLAGAPVSPAVYDHLIAPGYGVWVYLRAADTITYPTGA